MRSIVARTHPAVMPALLVDRLLVEAAVLPVEALQTVESLVVPIAHVPHLIVGSGLSVAVRPAVHGAPSGALALNTPGGPAEIDLFLEVDPRATLAPVFPDQEALADNLTLSVLFDQKTTKKASHLTFGI